MCSYQRSYGPNDKRGEHLTRRKTSQKRGCQCHFIVKVMVQSPHIAILTYNMYEHEHEQSWPCHGKMDTSSEAMTLHKPKLTKDIVAYVESYYLLGVSIDSTYKMHIDKHVDMDPTILYRDFLLSRKYIVNIYSRLMRGKYHLHQKDEMSVYLWYQKR